MPASFNQEGCAFTVLVVIAGLDPAIYRLAKEHF
jgi:hypothetical protein